MKNILLSVAATALMLFISSGQLASAQTGLRQFNDGEIASAEDVNHNFSALEQRIESKVSGDQIYGQLCPVGEYVRGISQLGELVCSGATQALAGQQIGETFWGQAGNKLAVIAINYDGTSIIVGGEGGTAARVYDLVSGMWVQRGADLNVEVALSRVAISGDGLVVALSDPLNDYPSNNAGCAWVFEWSEAQSNWLQRGTKLCGGTDADLINNPTLNYDGSVIALDEFQYAYNWEGRVRVWQWTQSSWNQIGEFIGETRYRQRSPSLSSDGTLLSVGSSRLDSLEGVAKVYEYLGNGNWQQKGQTISLGADYHDIQTKLSANGQRILLTGTSNASAQTPHSKIQTWEWNSELLDWRTAGTAIFGSTRPSADLNDDGTLIIFGDSGYSSVMKQENGRVRVFRQLSGNWTNIFTAEGDADGDWAGLGVAVSSNGAVFGYGAILADNEGAPDAGYVKIIATP